MKILNKHDGKRKHEKNQIQKMGEELKQSNTREVYKYIKQMREGYKPRTHLGRCNEGQINSNQATIKATWKHYFHSLLTEPPQTNKTHKNRTRYYRRTSPEQ